MRAAIDVRPSPSRHLARTEWLRSLNSFSFGAHSDSDNTHFGLLLVSNEDTIEPGTGFDTHPHRDMEIVTWVLEGALVHKDSTGHSRPAAPGRDGAGGDGTVRTPLRGSRQHLPRRLRRPRPWGCGAHHGLRRPTDQCRRSRRGGTDVGNGHHPHCPVTSSP
ncbi:pirin family protein [Streptomyces fagopyri]|uniref:pirin family protein n=1 Tax=Streptomyces fagopyri TaxID=2662397 RepID=UPI0036812D02